MYSICEFMFHMHEHRRAEISIGTFKFSAGGYLGYTIGILSGVKLDKYVVQEWEDIRHDSILNIHI
jgi:hypothetical protein